MGKLADPSSSCTGVEQLPAVLMPEETSKRLRDRIEALSKLTEVRLFPAKGERHFVHFTSDDLDLFDGEGGEPYILAVRNHDLLTVTIPEKEGDRSNYIPVRNEKALQRIDPFWSAKPAMQS
ncbi:hypothetical protein AADZ90_001230 [Aestuariibius sp. 2305UL40-4]|uniref:hypothetical protein n=1 Tax=Aestuariibius violaceus TaxID=3234132 RepID=UPI00345E9148